MLRVFQIYNKQKIEILPQNNIFDVLELGLYEIFYESDSLETTNVFLEDILLDPKKINQNNNTLILSEFRYFENYFGYASLNINKCNFFFNIKIEKLKLSEIEDIFLYLWKKEGNLFNIFISKSTYEVDFRKDGFELGETSKLLSFIDVFIKTFEQLYFSFQNLPHTVLRKYPGKTKYDPNKISIDTVDWILNNLDEINFNHSFKSHYNSIQVNNNYGIVDNILTFENKNSPDVYENQIILGAFIIVLKKINQLRQKISSTINIKPTKDEAYADFRDLKKIPFIKLFEDSISLEKKVIKLFNKYKYLFPGIVFKIEKPMLN